MSSASDIKINFSPLDRPLPENAILIIGAGHFGERAVRMLNAGPQKPLLVIDRDENQLAKISDLNVTKVLADGVQFLSDHYAWINPSNMIVPAIPVHLALEWLKRHLQEKHQGYYVKLLPIPKETPTALPHTWDGQDGSLLISFADFKCPDDCPEPAEACTVTGERRSKPLHALLAEINRPEYETHVIVSRQLAPGLGGYAFVELQRLLHKVLRAE
ncbi:MAG: hypothetical protein EHM45_00390, partial [Desulfobacteraceae bacterium]